MHKYDTTRKKSGVGKHTQWIPLTKRAEAACSFRVGAGYLVVSWVGQYLVGSDRISGALTEYCFLIWMLGRQVFTL